MLVDVWHCRADDGCEHALDIELVAKGTGATNDRPPDLRRLVVGQIGDRRDVPDGLDVQMAQDARGLVADDDS